MKEREDGEGKVREMHAKDQMTGKGDGPAIRFPGFRDMRDVECMQKKKKE